jgi:rubredoxin
MWEDVQLRLIDAFRIFDKSGDNIISMVEMRRGLRSLAVGLSDEDVEALAVAVDSDHDGGIDYKEFVSFFRPLTEAERGVLDARSNQAGGGQHKAGVDGRCEICAAAAPLLSSAWVCGSCKHVYDAARDGGGEPFEQLRAAWACPVCSTVKSAYATAGPAPQPKQAIEWTQADKLRRKNTVSMLWTLLGHRQSTVTEAEALLEYLVKRNRGHPVSDARMASLRAADNPRGRVGARGRAGLQHGYSRAFVAADGMRHNDYGMSEGAEPTAGAATIEGQLKEKVTLLQVYFRHEAVAVQLGEEERKRLASLTTAEWTEMCDRQDFFEWLIWLTDQYDVDPIQLWNRADRNVKTATAPVPGDLVQTWDEASGAAARSVLIELAEHCHTVYYHAGGMDAWLRFAGGAEQFARPGGGARAEAELGLGHIVALHCRSSTSHQNR